MKVYNVYPDDYDYDQYKGVVIVAENEAQVLEMLKDPPYGGATYFESSQGEIHIEEVDLTKPSVILASFNAG